MTVPAAAFINSSTLICISPPRLAPLGYPASASAVVEVGHLQKSSCGMQNVDQLYQVLGLRIAMKV